MFILSKISQLAKSYRLVGKYDINVLFMGMQKVVMGCDTVLFLCFFINFFCNFQMSW